MRLVLQRTRESKERLQVMVNDRVMVVVVAAAQDVHKQPVARLGGFER